MVLDLHQGHSREVGQGSASAEVAARFTGGQREQLEQIVLLVPKLQLGNRFDLEALLPTALSHQSLRIRSRNAAKLELGNEVEERAHANVGIAPGSRQSHIAPVARSRSAVGVAAVLQYAQHARHECTTGDERDVGASSDAGAHSASECVDIMKHLALFLMFLASLNSMASSDEPPTPAQRFRQLTRDYNTVSREIIRSKTVEDRKVVARRFDEFAKKFLDIADEHPQDPIALSAIRSAVQAIVTTDSRAQNIAESHPGTLVVGSSDGSAQRVVRLLMRDHLQSDRLAPICDRIRFSYRPEFEPFLVAALKENAHRDVHGLAQLAVGQLRHNQLRLMDLASDRPELAARYGTIYGQGYIDRLERMGRDQLIKRMESAYEEAIQFDDVTNIPFQTSVAEKAKRELHELRHLSQGKRAPEIQGQDQAGRPFKLTDYRGKVVLLYFWQEHCLT